MKTTLGEKVIAYLALISGLSISAVAVYYSVAGLTAIFAAAVIPIIIMGVTLELSKLVATVWVKQNWDTAPVSIRAYLIVAIVTLMLITSLGIFGFLSKAHNDQNLVSGDVTSKIAIYDEKIKVEKENIDANRKSLKQLDEAVDQVMARSQDEKGADKAVAIRRAQQKDRSRLSQEINESQKRIAELNDARAPIAAEVRKVEAEVGPIKYIAAFIYGANPDSSILERAVTWIIILIVIVFDPLAVVLLLASQYSFQQFRKREEDVPLVHNTVSHTEIPISDPYVADVGEPPTAEELVEDDIPVTTATTSTATISYQILEDTDDEEDPIVVAPTPVVAREESKVVTTKVFARPSVTIPLPETYVQNEEQKESSLWTNTVENVITHDEYIRVSQEKSKKE